MHPAKMVLNEHVGGRVIPGKCFTFLGQALTDLVGLSVIR